MFLVLHHGALGDFILALSVIQAVRAATGAAHVATIASAPSAAIAAGRSAVDQRFSPEQVGLHTLFGEACPLDARLVDLIRQAQLILSFLGDSAGPVHQRLRAATPAKVISIDPVPTARTTAEGVHITRQWSESIRQAGLTVPDPLPAEIRLPNAAHAGTSAKRRRQVIIHPGSGGRPKCWPLERFIALANTLTDAEVTWMLGPAECEPGDGRFDALRQRVDARREPLMIEADLQRAAERIAAADRYIGNDSGMTHLAAALGVPTLAIFVGSDPRIWRPLGDHVTWKSDPLVSHQRSSAFIGGSDSVPSFPPEEVMTQRGSER